MGGRGGFGAHYPLTDIFERESSPNSSESQNGLNIAASLQAPAKLALLKSLFRKRERWRQSFSVPPRYPRVTQMNAMSIIVNTECRCDTYQGIVLIQKFSIVGSFCVPERSASHFYSLALLLRDDNLHDILISGQLKFFLDLVFDLVR